MNIYSCENLKYYLNMLLKKKKTLHNENELYRCLQNTASETSRTMKTATYRASEFALLKYRQNDQSRWKHNARNTEMLCGQTVEQPGINGKVI
jgi:hypothetical protein